jgi:hypothetical protein
MLFDFMQSESGCVDSGELEDFLTLGHSPKFFSASNNSERYGFAYLLADVLGLKFPRRPFGVNWQHGVYSHGGPAQIEAYLASGAYSNRQNLVVVGTTRDAHFVRSHGHENVIVAGLPFAYVPQTLHRRRRILLAFPGHSAEAASEKIDINSQYLSYLCQFKGCFDQIWISAYGLDTHQLFYQKAREMGFVTVFGAHPSDQQSLHRSRAALDLVSHVTSNTIGSHLFYALSAGCRVSVCGPLFLCQGVGSDGMRHAKCSAGVLLEACLYGGQFTDDEVNKLFVESPLHGLLSIDFGRRAIGADHIIRDPRVVCAIMRWGIGDQVQGYFSGAVRRASRVAKNLQICI